jgi:superfamily II DNA or RNA helicase
LKPQTPGPSFGPALDDAFPVYRENEKKIYIPRFYGIERYGTPERSEIAPGMDIDVAFPKELRDYQNNIVDVYMKAATGAASNKPIGCTDEGRGVRGNHGFPAGGILEIYCGAGKCLGINTPILMFDGSVKMVQDVQVGDLLMGDDSTPRNVLTLARGREKMYKISASDDESYVANESHILSLKVRRNYSKAYVEGDIHDISVKDYLALPKTVRGILLGYRAQIEYSEQPVPLDPYVMGHLVNIDYNLHNEHNGETCKATISKDVYDYIHKVTNMGQIYEEYNLYVINYWRDPLLRTKMNEFRERSHIPAEYKCNSRDVRLRMLAGILDSCTATTRFADNYIMDVVDNGTLTNDVIWLARSLGFGASIRVSYQLRGARHRVVIRIYGDIGDIPVECDYFRIINKTCMKHKSATDYTIKLTELEVDNYYGFEIDGNHRFVLGDHTVTHNTVMALKIVSLLKKKTLILVHKEFLMNQWIERIEEFLPGARVGKIQASVCDTEDKDIVIGMIQTMYNKVFPQEIYSQFGLTIIDEVHRIGSEEFSKTLLKTITPYMLGISATVERKDKLTKLLYMFIGPKIHSMLRKQEDTVNVRGIEFVANDAEFNEVERDWKGQPKYSTMISKICEFGPRRDFIVKVVRDLVKESPESQIMVLAHNRSLLTYLYEVLNAGVATPRTPPACGISSSDDLLLAGGLRGSAEGATSAKLAAAAPVAGFYVGGMKQKDLDITETKQIVLATYAMAAEALDIKTLSTLVMATPKTDITQSVGRILRMKHDNPIIVDIIDTHDTFQNQWKLRKRFYKKANYKIVTSTSKKYTDMEATEWFSAFDPKGKKGKDDDDDDDDKKKTATEFGGKCCIDMSGL